MIAPSIASLSAIVSAADWPPIGPTISQPASSRVRVIADATSGSSSTSRTRNAFDDNTGPMGRRPAARQRQSRALYYAMDPNPRRVLFVTIGRIHPWSREIAHIRGGPALGTSL